MKKLNLIIALVAIVSFVNAQRNVTGEISASKDLNLSLAKEVTDTIMPANFNMDSIALYTTSDSNGNFAGFVAGINTYADQAKVQQYNAGTEGYKVAGGLMIFGAKMDLDTIANNNGGFDFILYDFDAEPTDVIASLTMTYEQIDTLGYTVALFDSGYTVTGDYCVGINMSASMTETSLLTVYGLFSTSIGGGNGDKYAWEQWSDGVWYQMDDAWGGFDANLAIFPVVEIPSIGIEEMDFFNGVKVSAYPNPATEVLNIEFSLENTADLSVNLVNINGQIIRTVKEANAANGTISMNVNDIAAGTYFISLEANNSRIAQRVVIK